MKKIMKKIAGLLTAAIVAGTLTVPFAASAETSADIGNGWTITYHNSWPQSETNYATFTTEEARSGDWSLKALSTSAMTNETSRITISHTALPTNDTAWGANSNGDGVYTTELYIKGGYGSGWGLRAGTFDSHSDNINGTSPALSVTKVNWGEPDENGWRRVSWTWSYPYGSNKTDFKIEIRAAGTPVYIDDVRVYHTIPRLDYPDLLSPLDGDFEPEPVATNEELSAYGWSLDKLSSTDNFTGEIVQEADGNKMLHVKYDAANNAYTKVKLNKTIETPANNIDWNSYRIYFKLKGTNLGQMEMGNDQYDNLLRNLTNGNFEQYIERTDLGDGWTQYAVTTAGKNAAGFRIQFYARAEVYLDDFAVVKLDSNGNEIAGDHLYNGSFDNPTSASERSSEEWFSAMGVNSTAQYVSTADASHSYTGTHSWFISGPGAWVSGASADARIALPADFDYTKSYTLKAKVYTPTPNTGLYVLFTNANNGATSQKMLRTADVTAADLGNGWYEYTTSMQAAAGYTQLALRSSGMTGGVWIDDVSLTDENEVNYIANGSFEKFATASFGSFALMDDGYETIQAPIAGENIVSINVNTFEAGNDYLLYLAIYKDGKLFRLNKIQSLDTAVGEQEMIASITLDTVDDGEYTAKAFLWNDDLTPYVPAAEYPDNSEV